MVCKKILKVWKHALAPLNKTECECLTTAAALAICSYAQRYILRMYSCSKSAELGLYLWYLFLQMLSFQITATEKVEKSFYGSFGVDINSSITKI